jgi:TP901 family phage tail tape measure protein
MGRDANGAMQAIAVRPLVLDMENLGTKTQIAAQRQALLNQMLKQGSTNLLNFGKNTQWAGRQLMVGFTVPLMMFGAVASKTFMDMEKQAIRFKRVYGELFTTAEETDKAVQDIRSLANEFTKYGIAASKTMEIAADIAAMGKMGADLNAQVAETTRLAVLGGVEQGEALKATISLTDAFGTSAEDLAKKIDFLNAVENQTVTSIEDLTTAIPKAGPVVRQLGGDVEDLTFFLTAMREGGINASESANALKSGLASMINPAEKSAKFLENLGINLKGIVEANKGDIRGTVIQFANALDTLDPLNRARAIEQLFGKFQFARLSTLFQNVTREGNQASRVLKLANATTAELAILSERELKRVEDSPMFKFQKAVEDIKVSLVPLGEAFLKAVTPILEFGTKILEQFNKLDEGAKSFVVALGAIGGVIGPVFLMGFGLVANGVANLIKMFVFFKTSLNKAASSSNLLGVQTEYMTQEQLQAQAVAASLNQIHQKLIQTFTSETAAVNSLTAAYRRSLAAQGAMSGGVIGRTRVPKKYASGVLSVPGPKGAGDVVPAMLSPGEAVIPARQSRKYSGIISSLIADNVPGFRVGRNPFASMLGRSRVAVRMKDKDFISSLRQDGKDARYKSAFETQTGADYIRESGSKTTRQRELRSAMERDVFGLDPKTTSPSSRPTYGYARTPILLSLVNRLFGLKGKNFNSSTTNVGDSLDKYGNIDLITKGSVAKRSSAFAGDALVNYNWATQAGTSRRIPDLDRIIKNTGIRPAPMRGASPEQLKGFERLGSPFGSNRVPGTNSQYWTNPKPAYVETYTPGGFSFKEIDKIIARDPAIAKQLKQELKAAGLGAVRVVGPGFVSRLFKNIGVPGFNDGSKAVTGQTDGKYWLDFLGKRFDLDGPSPNSRPKYYADNLPKTIEMMQSKGRSNESILTRIESLYGRKNLSPSNLNKTYTASGKKQEYTVSGGSPRWMNYLTSNVKASGMFNDELGFLQDRAKKLGISDSQLARFSMLDASHFIPKGTGVKNWEDISKIGPDIGGINNYLNRVGGNLGKHLMALNDNDLKRLKINRKELEKLVAGEHPKTKASALTLRSIAEFDEKVWSPKSRNKDVRKGTYQATLTKELLDRRFKQKLYERGLRSYAELIDQKVIQDTRRQSKAISGANENVPSNVRVKGGSASDTKMAAVSPGETILTKKTNRELMSGRPVSIPGFGRLARLAGGSSSFPRLPGFADGSPEGQYADGTERVYKTEGGQYRDRATKKRLQAKEAKRIMAQDRQNERRRAKSAEKRATAEKRSSSIGQSYGMSSKDWDKATRDEQAKLRAQRKQDEAAEKRTREAAKNARIADEQKIAEEKKKLAIKEEKRAERQAKMQGMGGKVAAGVGALAMVGVIGGSMMGGQIGEISNQLMMPVMMLSMMLPMLANPIGLAVAAVGGLAVAAFMLDQQFKQNIKKAYELETALGSGAKAIQPLADAAGKVTASEIMDRTREDRLNPFEVKQGKTTFGQSFVQSEAGQGLKGTVSKAFLELGRDASISKLVNQMATAVMSGAVSPQQARSVVAALAQELGDTDLGVSVNARLTELLGPNGENILTNGLEIRTKLLQETRSSISLPGGKYVEPKRNLGEKILDQFFPQEMFSRTVDLLQGGSVEKARAGAGDIGSFVANSTIALQQQKQMVDSLDLEYEQKIKNAKISVNEAKTAKERKAAQEDLNDLEEEYSKNRSSLVEENALTVDAIKQQIKAIGNPTEVINAFKGQIKELYKDDVIQSGVLDGLLGRIDAEGTDALTAEQSIILNAELNAGNIDPLTLSNILNGENDELVIDIITKFGGTEADRIFDLANLIKDPVQKADFLDVTADMDIEKLNEYLSGIENIYKLTASGTVGKIIFEAILDEDNAELRNKINAQQDSLQDLAEKKPLTIKTIQELVTSGTPAGKTVMDVIKANQEYFDGLSEEDKVKYVQSVTVSANLEGNLAPAFRAWQIEKGGKETSFGAVVGGGTYNEFLHDQGFITTETGSDNTTPEGETPDSGDTGGAKKENPYNSINKSLKELRNNAVNATGGIKELQKWLGKGKDMRPFKGTMNALVAGGTTEEFQDFASNLSKKQQRDLFTVSDGVAKLTGKGKALQKAFNEVSIGRFVIDQQRALANAKNQDIAAKRLIAAGMSTSDAYEAVEDSAFAAGIATMKLGKKGREELKTIVDSAKKAKNALEGLSPDDLSDILKESIDVARDRIQIDFEFKVAGDMGVLRAAESEISALQFQIDDFQAGLQQISWKEDEINKKYDKRSEALDKINTINSQIADQQKGQLSIADALSRGDLSAAAKAIQDFRASEAQRALDGQKNALEAARERELAAVRSSDGKSRIQLEDSILEKEKAIFKIEEERLEPARERVRLAESAKDIALTSLDLQGLEYDDLTNKIKSAELGTVEYEKKLKEALATLQEMAKVKLPVSGDTGAGSSGTVMTKETRGSYLGDVVGPNYAGTAIGMIGPGGQFIWTGDKWVKRALGGYVSGPGTATSDSIPAMLSDGEYVVRASSVNKFGKGFLDQVNAGTLPGFKRGGMAKPKYFANAKEGFLSSLRQAQYQTSNLREPSFQGASNGPTVNANTLATNTSTVLDNSSVYNYNLSVNVASMSDPNTIAQTVMGQIRQIDSQRLRGNRF